MKTDPNYKKQDKYRSGNDGRLHPGMKHSGYYQPKRRYVNEARLAVMSAFLRAVSK